MANAGSFKKGQKRPNQGKRGPGKATLNAREAIARLVDSNADRLQVWLDEIAEREGPLAAWRCMMDVIEYHIPKLQRTEHIGDITVRKSTAEMTDEELARRAQGESVL